MKASLRVTRRLLAAAAAVVLVASPGTAVAQQEPLGHAGRWITAADGRVVVLHGFNVVPVDEQNLPRDMGMGADNARWLAEHGFNTVRLGLFYARVEPQPGQFDDAYLEDYLRVQRELSKEGIFTLLDVHQDQLNPRYGVGGPIPSRGFPDWFLKEDGLPNTATPYPNGYTSNPALNRAYDNIWKDFAAPDGVSVQTHFARGWQHLASVFGARPRMLGYDVFNEPWPGTPWATCATPLGCPPAGFDQTRLTAFTRKIVAALRAADARHLIFYEPNLEFDYGAATRVKDPFDTNAGFTFHDYCIGILAPVQVPQLNDLCTVGEEMPFANAEAQSQRTGDALLLSEFGFLHNAAAFRMPELADDHMMSWQWWDYYGDHTTFDDATLAALVRPYPQIVAGTPTSWHFDGATRQFDLAFTTSSAATVSGGDVSAPGAAPARFVAGSRTKVFVPALHYPDGYRVDVSGAKVVSAAGAQELVLSTCAGALEVRVRVTRGTAVPTSCAP